MKLKTYIVEDNATIRENLIGTLEELACVESVGIAETEEDGKSWLTRNPGNGIWPSLTSSCAKAVAWACWRLAVPASPTSGWWC